MLARCKSPYLFSLALLLPLTAQAVDGTITLTGEITDSTCKINGSAPPAHILVTLPKIATSALKTKGDTAGATIFTIALTDCPASLTGDIKAHFEPGVTTDYVNGALHAYTTDSAIAKASSIPADQTSKGKATNVVIQLANSDGTPIAIGAADSNTKGVALSAGTDGKKTADLRYMARYLKSTNENIASGKLYTYVNYSIAYP